ncbi:hypothetical protein [Lacrimispora sp. 38-1]|uniref:hypothetical protein n=1 Tax=Lacrimispora sp. 38-1 TaxID=3125778 RepID=UPI003CEEB18F
MDQDNQMNLDDPSVTQKNEIQPVFENSGGEQNNGGYNTVYQQPQQPQQPQQKKQNNMALASLIMGIIGIVTSCCCYGGLIFGSLGIVFALLSRTEDHFEGNAVAGLITSIIALVLTVIVLILIVALGLLDELTAGGAFH